MGISHQSVLMVGSFYDASIASVLVVKNPYIEKPSAGFPSAMV